MRKGGCQEKGINRIEKNIFGFINRFWILTFENDITTFM